MNTRVFYSICAAVSAMALFAACEKEKERPEQGQEAGQPVVFRCATSYDKGSDTKTAYSGVVTGGKERIDWVVGDEIVIMSDKAYSLDESGEPFQIYAITDVNSGAAGAVSTASIEPCYGMGFFWVDNSVHKFYALYPSHYQNWGVEILSADKFRLRIPSTQEYTAEGTTLKPDMNYAYMGCYATSSPAATSVDLDFYPMFTAFQFTIDSWDDSMTLTSFTLSSGAEALNGTFTAQLGIYSTPDYTGFPEPDENNKKITLQFNGGNGITITKGNPIRFTVFALPKTCKDLTASFTTDAGETKSFELKDNNGAWLNFEGGAKHHISLELPGAWSYQLQVPMGGGSITLSGDELIYGATRDITVSSYKERAGVTKGEPWVAYAQAYNGEFVTPGDVDWPDWLTLSKTSGSGSATGEQVTLSVAPNWPKDQYGDPLFDYLGGEDMAYNLNSMTSEVGSESSPRDLSLYNIYGEPYSSQTSVTSITHPGHHTANCYVVSAPGWYCFPLVYGNAFDTDSSPSGPNEAAYKSTSSEAYWNSKNQPISSPDILGDLGLTSSTTLDAVVVWQDVVTGADIIREVPVIMDAPAESSLSCKYIRFHIGAGNILPGNILIALRDKGDILWSWHIWVTETPHALDTDDFKIRSLTYRTTQEENGPTQTLGLLNCNLGWTPPLMFKKVGASTARSTKIKIESSNASFEFEVEQAAAQTEMDPYNEHLYSGTYYQWGRKDPFLPSAGYYTVYNRVCTSRHYTIVSGQAGLNNSNLSGNVSNWIRQPYVFDNYTSSTRWRYDLWNANIPDSNEGRTYDAVHALMNTAVRKTIYDPCPAGFCVPLGRTFTGFTSNGYNYGVVDSGKIYGLPMTRGNGSHGYYWRDGFNFSYDGTNNSANYTLNFQNLGARSGADGSITGLNESGYYWTGVTQGTTQGWMLQITNDWNVSPVVASAKRNGYSIRPVLER